MKAYWRVIAILISLAMPSPVSMTGARMPQTSTRIHGTVVDDRRKLIVGAEVKVSGSGKTVQTLTDGSGTYSLEVKSGKYVLDVEKDLYCPFHRGSVVIQEGSNVEFNFQLPYQVPSGHSVQMKGEEPQPRIISRYCHGGYDYNDIPPQDGLPMGGTIMSGLSENDGAATKYDGVNAFGGFVQAVLTFDQTTIHANTLTYDSKKHTVRGNGAIVWEDGTGTVKSGSTILVKIRAPKPIISISK